LPKDRKEEMLRLAGMMGRLFAGGLGGERDDFLGGKREVSIILDSRDGASDYSLTNIFLAVDLQP
jgi:hypothetical protein